MVCRGVHHQADLSSWCRVGEQGCAGKGGLDVFEGSFHLFSPRDLVLGSGLSSEGICERLQQVGHHRQEKAVEIRSAARHRCRRGSSSPSSAAERSALIPDSSTAATALRVMSTGHSCQDRRFMRTSTTGTSHHNFRQAVVGAVKERGHQVKVRRSLSQGKPGEVLELRV
jgi:hypothetical protein